MTRRGRRSAACGRGKVRLLREIVTAEGSLILTEAALAAIAGHAALRCPGVAATVPRRLQEELARWLRDPPAAREPREAGTAEIDLDGEHCRVSVDIVVVFGARIAEVCRAVAHAVAEDIRRTAGFPPDHIDVRVVDVRAIPLPRPGQSAAAGPELLAHIRRDASGPLTGHPIAAAPGVAGGDAH